ncbi:MULTISPECIES: hypothetical protein [unclassified Pseudoalteromonas]|uniref:hypothetical protein n=1 Tax=unclassified Pseudoalteromonas TaxID=194690 RepID=UPI0005A95984|nr:MULTISPECIES: hypothetical protein [unclassified Pseudoalteromonas]
MEIKSSTPVLNPLQIKHTPAQKIDDETVKTNNTDSVTISAEAQELLDEVKPNRGGGDVIIKKPNQ